MLSFTPPIKASLLITLVYMVCFRIFLHSGNPVWLYPANVFFVICSVLYIRFLNRTNAKLTMPMLTAKGTRLSFKSSLLCFAGAGIVLLVDTYLLKSMGSAHYAAGIKHTAALLFLNTFVVNLVCGSLGAFITAGLMNEKEYTLKPGHLPSVKR